LPRFRRRIRRSRTSKRRVYWDGGLLSGNLDFGAGPGEEMQYLWWIRWPSGVRETTDETGIFRSGEIMQENVTLERLRLIVGLTADVPFPLGMLKITMGATAIECHDPATFDNIVQTGGGLLGGPNFNPDPTYDVNDDWIIREPFLLFNTSTIATSRSAVFGFPNLDQYESRARRKLPAGVGILGVMSAFGTPEDQTPSLQFQVDYRALYRAGNLPS